tara:strand:- start:7 stop:1131 length:1125 start_codon:yes stop_codon:yes gene_type:complete
MKTIEEAEYKSKNFILNNNKFIETGDSFKKYTIAFEGLNTFGIPNASVNIRKEKTPDSLMKPSSLVFEAKYTFDNQGRRNTSLVKGKKDKVALFFGDAHCFGEGLNDNETLPYYFSLSNNKYNCTNYGFLGHGPNHMLYRVQLPEFQKQYNNKEGKIFFIYRDDAVKISVGKVPWSKGHPKYNNEINYEGPFTSTGEEMYLPSSFTDEDYNFTLKLFLEINKTVKSISKKLDFYIVIIPLSFSNYYIEPLLEKNNLNVINLYTVDLEKITKGKARFLDGVHTKYSNEIICSYINQFLSGKKMVKSLQHTEYKNLKDIKDRLTIEANYMPSMTDFPYDDAGVIISNVLKNYTGNENFDYQLLLDYLKEKFYEQTN